jgi:hypothetical protein
VEECPQCGKTIDIRGVWETSDKLDEFEISCLHCGADLTVIVEFSPSFTIEVNQ